MSHHQRYKDEDENRPKNGRKYKNQKNFPLQIFFGYFVIFGKNSKIGKVKNFWSKIFLVGIELESFKSYLKPKTSKSKIFCRVKFFLRQSHFMAKRAVIVKKWPSKNLLVDLLVRIIQNVSKRILNQKSRNRKIFLWLNHF